MAAEQKPDNEDHVDPESKEDAQFEAILRDYNNQSKIKKQLPPEGEEDPNVIDPDAQISPFQQNAPLLNKNIDMPYYKCI